METENQRLSNRRIFESVRTLTECEQKILKTLYFARFMTTTQIKQLFFDERKTELAAKRATNRAMKKLEALKFVKKLRRQVGGLSGGSTQAIYLISTAGIKGLGFKFPDQVWNLKKRMEVPQLLFLEHSLAISETFTRLKGLEHQGKLLELHATFEPACWRNFNNGKTDLLKPDLFVRLVQSDNIEFESLFFLEVDRETESLNRILEKCKLYVSYYNAGIEQRLNGVFPFVVWLVPSRRRKEQLERWLHEKLPKAESLFQVIEFSELEALVCHENHQ